MMNSRPGFSIRRLISQHRPRGIEDTLSDSANEDFAAAQDGHRRLSRDELARANSQRSQKSRSWKRTKNPPQPIVVVSGSRAVHMISGPLPPLPDTPRSAASSLCSCDCRGSPRTPACATPPLCSVRSKTPDTLSPLLSPRTLKLEEMGLLLQEPADSTVPLTLVQTLSPVSDIPEWNASQQDTRAKRKTSPADQQSVEDMSENVRQLIRDTDEAFKAVGTALSEARRASQSPTIKSPPANESKFAFALPQSPRWPGSRAAPRSPVKIASPLNSPTRRASVSKTKRRKSKKGRRNQEQQPKQKKKKNQGKDSSAVAPKTGPRWTLPENMSELLNGRLFHRIEVDEIQTPDQVQEWRQKNRLPRPDMNMSTETLRTLETDGSDTPIEPFHLEDLPSRIGAAGVRLSMLPSPTVDTAVRGAFDFGLDVVRKDFSAEHQKQPATAAARPGRGGEDPMTFQNVSFPTPPQKNPMRTLPRRQLPPLPTIPEVMVTGPDGTLRKNQPQQQQGSVDNGGEMEQAPEMKQAKVTDEFVVLQCSPYTMTMPTFRHGPIRFSRTGINVLDPTQLVADEALDWTAFQMAILGGAGDFLSDGSDSTNSSDAEETDQLAGWLDELGVGGIGRLTSCKEDEQERHVGATLAPARDYKLNEKAGRAEQHKGKQKETEQEREQEQDEDEDDDNTTERAGSIREQANGPPALDTALALQCPPSPAVTAEYSPISSTGSSSASTQPEMVQIQRTPPLPLVIERPPGIWNAKFEFGSQGIRRWVLESSQPEQPSKERAGSHDSLPQSPMLDLVVSRGISGEDYIVPMGYNLGHDLGDFLKWESENVYAGSFHG